MNPKVHNDQQGEEVCKRASLKQLFQHADRIDVPLMIIGFVHALGAGLGMPGIILLFGDMMDQLGSESTTESFTEKVNELCLMFIYLGIGLWYCVFVSTICWKVVGDRQAMKIKALYIRSVLRQDIAWFDKNKVTELPTRIITATVQIQEGIGKRIGEGIQFITQFLALYVVGFFFSWKISLVIMAGFPAITLAAFYLQRVIKQKGASDDKNYASAGAVATEALSAIRTVFSLNGQTHELSRYQNHLETAEKAGRVSAFQFGLGNGGIFSVMFALYALGFWFGALVRARALENGCLEDDTCITGGDVITVFFAILAGSMSIGQAGPSFQALSQALDAGGRIFDTIDRIPGIDALSEKGKTLPTVEGRITVHNLTFYYPTRPDNLVYQGFKLNINPGENVALVGPSGEGKSTLVSLVLRFYDPQEGAILLDDVNIQELNVSWYRSQLGYVGQEPVLFAGSVRQNIKHGNVDATVEEIEAAAKAANAHEFITSFPKGYDTDVGEAGAQISGGQKQRIAIARALIKCPKILLLDEATSALDNESERVVQQALDDIQKGSQFTTIVIAHRLTTIQNCDKIAVISDGRVAELGSHLQLLEQPDSLYAKLAAQKDATERDEKKDQVGDRLVDSDKSIAPATLKRGRSKSNSGPKLRSRSASEKDIEAGESDTAEGKVPMKRLLSLGQDKWPFLVLGCLGCVVVGGAFPVQGILIARAHDMFYQVDVDNLRYEGELWAGGFVAFAAVVLLGNIVRFYGLGVFGERITSKIRYECFKAILARSIVWFDREENAPGALVEKLAVDIAKIQVLAGGVLGSSLNLAFALLVGFSLSFGYSWQMALGVLGTIPFMSIGAYIQMKIIAGDQNLEGIKDNTEAGATITAAIQGIRTVHAFGMQYTVSEAYGQALAKEEEGGKRTTIFSSLALGYGQCSPLLVYAWCFWLGALLIKKGEINFEEMLTSLFCLITVAFAMGDSATLAGDQKAGKFAAQDIFELLDSADDLEPVGGSTPSQTQGQLEFKNIKFAYPQRPNILIYDGFNLTVQAGSTVALCGPSGGGKSTVMGLLLRFYTPLEGSITLDGKDIRDIDLQWLRNQIGYVSQEPVLFSGSIRSNICYGMKNVSEQAMVDVTKVARAHDFVSSFQDQYETDVGEKSMLLSGGQKQRLAIARAILKKPKILLLDEATSALDYENEKEVQQALDNLQVERRNSTGLTTLIIAHRLSTIQNADAIAVIEAGKIVEIGSHNQLMSINGLYKKLATISSESDIVNK